MDIEARLAAFLSFSTLVVGERVDDGYDKSSTPDVEGSATKGVAAIPVNEYASRERRRMDFRFLDGLADPELDTVVSVSVEEMSPLTPSLKSVNSSSSSSTGESPRDDTEDKESLDVVDPVCLVVPVESLSMLLEAFDLWGVCRGFQDDTGEEGLGGGLEKSEMFAEMNLLTPCTPSRIPSSTVGPPLSEGECRARAWSGSLALKDGMEGRVVKVE